MINTFENWVNQTLLSYANDWNSLSSEWKLSLSLFFLWFIWNFYAEIIGFFFGLALKLFDLIMLLLKKLLLIPIAMIHVLFLNRKRDNKANSSKVDLGRGS